MDHTIHLPDPFNLIITGVGGQGNVLASKVVGNMLMEKGLNITIGETFGASQRGGSVMSHLRISPRSGFSPQIPKGKAHLVIALEPTEALRVLKDYGNPKVNVLCNIRPIHSIGVISGDQDYPLLESLQKWIRELCEQAWFINATDAAITLGNPILGNVIMVGALAATRMLPLDRGRFESVITRTMPAAKVEINLAAFDRGRKMIDN
ncbi:MAG: indolepyruvate ferredoxin oxidoreductase [Deltaproteobacteria bacterium]|nr:MAG: indolepyruvate ferredoxin oxidoreductase [Deltaproteobacteria bacterium]